MQPRPPPEESGGWWRRAWQRLRTAQPADDGVRGLDEERRALKLAVQRRRRNDRVRHQELDELRELMRAKQAEATSSQSAYPAGAPSTSAVGRSGWPRASSDKTRTIEQIARIEAQMSQQWTPRTTEASGLRIGAPAAAKPVPGASPHLQARSSHGFGMSIDLVTVDPVAQQAEFEALLAHPALTEAAVRFANGRLDEARVALESLEAQEVRSPLARAAGLLLLDLLWASGDVEGFEEWAAEWADRFRLPVPRWPTVVPPPEAPAPAEPASDTGSVWSCPPLLDTAAVQTLAEQVGRPDGVVWLDWSDLLSADIESAELLAALFERWAEQPLALRWRGGAVLRRRLKASTPSGRRENHPAWWRLRLAALRLMGRRDEFDLVALDYCVTYGELPPDWREPLARVEAAETLPDIVVAPAPPASSQAASPSPAEPLDWPEVVSTVAAGETEFPAMTTQMADWAVQTTPAAEGAVSHLEGVLQGDIGPVLGALDAASGAAPTVVIDARRLQRVDFAAAGALLQWLLGARGRGQHVELRGVSHLLAVLFHVVGIDEAATVRLRQY